MRKLWVVALLGVTAAASVAAQQRTDAHRNDQGPRRALEYQGETQTFVDRPATPDLRENTLSVPFYMRYAGFDLASVGNDRPNAHATVNGVAIYDATPGELLNFDGLSSTDVDGSITAYRWRKVFGVEPLPTTDPNADGQFFDNAPVPSAYPGCGGQCAEYLIELQVTDDRAATALDFVVVRVQRANNAPVAEVEYTARTYALETAPSGAIHLGGSDPDGDTITGDWTHVGGDAFQFTRQSADNPPPISNPFYKLRIDFGPVPAGGSLSGTYRWRVTDALGATASQNVTITVNNASTNTPPTVEAGSDQSVSSGQAVSLAGSATDPDGDAIVDVTWEQVAGEGVTLTNARTLSPSFTAPNVHRNSTLSFILQARDARGAMSTDTVSVLVAPNVLSNTNPQADAGPDTQVNEGQATQLQGDAYDVDGDEIALQWSVLGPDSQVRITQNSHTATPTVVALAGSQGKTYDLQLAVTDALGGSATDHAQLEVLSDGAQQAPVIVLDWVAWQATSGQSVTNTAYAQDDDGDGSIASWQWSQVGGPATAWAVSNLPDENGYTRQRMDWTVPVVTATTVYLFRVEAVDAQGHRSTRTFRVTARPGESTHPFAVAGPDAQMYDSETLTLDGTGSDDPNGPLVAYAWTWIGGATGTITGANQAVSAFTPTPVTATQVAQLRLTVTDEDGNTASDDIAITVIPTPVPGACGSANGSSTAYYPATDHCAQGTANATDTAGDDGAFDWQCQGRYGGSTASCSAPAAPIHGACGASNGVQTYNYPTGGYCLEGSYSAQDTAGSDGDFDWQCLGIHGGTAAPCSAPRRQDGGCGGAHGGSYTSYPASAHCAVGTHTPVDTTGNDNTWDWQCEGVNGGTPAACSAAAPPGTGACGTAHRTTSNAYPGSGLCDSGTHTAVDNSASDGTWNWTCTGERGGTLDVCHAFRPVNGSCGSAADNGLPPAESSLPEYPTANRCASGRHQALDAQGDDGQYNWRCAGVAGGNNATCFRNAAVVNGSCGSADGVTTETYPATNHCATGRYVAGSDNPDGAAFTWTCQGRRGGTTTGCEAAVRKHGQCGTAHGQATVDYPATDAAKCAEGVIADGNQDPNVSPYTWSCQGIEGGSSASCNATVAPIHGACGAAHTNARGALPPQDDACAAGTVQATDEAGLDGQFDWSCQGDRPGHADAACWASATHIIDGECGFAVTGGTGAYPADNHCWKGTHDPVDTAGTDGYFDWRCVGLNSGVTQNCQVSSEPSRDESGAVAACGEAHGTTTVEFPDRQLCSAGKTNAVDANGTDGQYDWECESYDSSAIAQCWATSQATGVAMCGDANGAPIDSYPTQDHCASGRSQAIDNLGEDGAFDWECAFPGASSSVVSCSAPHRYEGICGKAHLSEHYAMPGSELCQTQNPPSTTDASGADGAYNWTCPGNNGGRDAACYAYNVNTNGTIGQCVTWTEAGRRCYSNTSLGDASGPSDTVVDSYGRYQGFAEVESSGGTWSLKSGGQRQCAEALDVCGYDHGGTLSEYQSYPPDRLCVASIEGQALTAVAVDTTGSDGRFDWTCNRSDTNEVLARCTSEAALVVEDPCGIGTCVSWSDGPQSCYGWARGQENTTYYIADEHGLHEGAANFRCSSGAWSQVNDGAAYCESANNSIDYCGWQDGMDLAYFQTYPFERLCRFDDQYYPVDVDITDASGSDGEFNWSCSFRGTLLSTCNAYPAAVDYCGVGACVAWSGEAGDVCYAQVNGAEGETKIVSDAYGRETGFATYTCQSGRWLRTGDPATCGEPPPTDLCGWREGGAYASLPTYPPAGLCYDQLYQYDQASPVTYLTYNPSDDVGADGQFNWTCDDQGTPRSACTATATAVDSCGVGACVSWTDGGQECFGQASAADGQTVTVTDDVGERTGTAGFRCTNGTWTQTGAASCATVSDSQYCGWANQGSYSRHEEYPYERLCTTYADNNELAEPLTYVAQDTAGDDGQFNWQCTNGGSVQADCASTVIKTCGPACVSWDASNKTCYGHTTAAAWGDRQTVTDADGNYTGTGYLECSNAGQWRNYQNGNCSGTFQARSLRKNQRQAQTDEAPAACPKQTITWGDTCQAEVAGLPVGEKRVVADEQGAGDVRVVCATDGALRLDAPRCDNARQDSAEACGTVPSLQVDSQSGDVVLPARWAAQACAPGYTYRPTAHEGAATFAWACAQGEQIKTCATPVVHEPNDLCGPAQTCRVGHVINATAQRWECESAAGERLGACQADAQGNAGCTGLDPVQWTHGPDAPVCAAFVPRGQYPEGATVQLTDPANSNYDLTPHQGESQWRCAPQGRWTLTEASSCQLN